MDQLRAVPEIRPEAVQAAAARAASGELLTTQAAVESAASMIDLPHAANANG